MKRYRVLCVWDISQCPGVLDELKQVADVDVVEPDRDILWERIAEYDAYMASLQVRLDRELIERAGRLKFCLTPSTGLDHLGLDALTERGIELLCIKDDIELLERITATAEMAWALLLAAVRKVPVACNAAMRGEWGRDRYRGRQLSGKMLGILGVGRLGTMMVDYGRAFRMEVIGCDPNPRKRVAGLEYVDFDDLLARSDVISIHVHLNERTRGLIDAAALARMKPGVAIINTSRGAIIDEAALLAALEAGTVGAAGLDVIEGEWRDDLVDHPLIRYAREHENVVIVPHLGGVTFESQEMALSFAAGKLARALRQLQT